MDVHAALEEVAAWCAQQTAAGDADEIEVECHATVWITIGESSPPWRVRLERGSSAGACSPVAQLRYDVEGRCWRLHHCERPQGWCDEDTAVRGRTISPLLDEVEADRGGRFQGLPRGCRWG